MRFLVVKLRTIICAIIMVVVAVLLSISFEGRASAEVFFGSSSRLVPIYSVETTKKQVAISFDSAWGAEKTQGILKILKDYNVSATFFLVGFWVEDYPEKVRAIDEAGVEIGCHSNTHPDMAKLTVEKINEELKLSKEKITSVTGKEVNLFRPPFGSYNNALLTCCKEQNLLAVQWDVDTLDWKGLSAAEMTNRVKKYVKPGSIILMHNNSDHILDGLKMILDYLKSQEYEVTSVGNLVYKDNFTIDRNGVQHKN